MYDRFYLFLLQEVATARVRHPLGPRHSHPLSALENTPDGDGNFRLSRQYRTLPKRRRLHNFLSMLSRRPLLARLSCQSALQQCSADVRQSENANCVAAPPAPEPPAPPAEPSVPETPSASGSSSSSATQLSASASSSASSGSPSTTITVSMDGDLS